MADFRTGPIDDSDLDLPGDQDFHGDWNPSSDESDEPDDVDGSILAYFQLPPAAPDPTLGSPPTPPRDVSPDAAPVLDREPEPGEKSSRPMRAEEDAGVIDGFLTAESAEAPGGESIHADEGRGWEPPSQPAADFFGLPDAEPQSGQAPRSDGDFLLINAFMDDGSDETADEVLFHDARTRKRRPRLQFPRPSEELAGFLIVGELGRGTFARVYLAKQENLGNRLVALKVSRAEGDEPEILARLQHSHIVPIHSVHDDPESGFRMICMPYLGGANLAQVLEAVGSRGSDPTHGQSLVDALDTVSRRLQSHTGLPRSTSTSSGISVSPFAQTRLPTELSEPESPGRPQADEPVSFILQEHPPAAETRRSSATIQSLWTRISGRSRSSTDVETVAGSGIGAGTGAALPDQRSRQFLREANRLQAAVWIIARLAEGLDHAHSKGLMHRDLKPSNILITDDGVPMLLDFNVSTVRRISVKDETTKVETIKFVLGGTLEYMALEHLDAISSEGKTPPEAVGEQADVFALTLILYEIIAGELPYPKLNDTQALREKIKTLIEHRRTVPSLRAACPEVPWSLNSIVCKGLDPDRSRRYRHARDLAEDLRRYLDDLPLRYASEPSLRERGAKWIRRHPRTTSSTSVGLLALILLCAAGGAIALLSNNLQGANARLRFRNFQSRFSECQLRLNTTSGPTEHLVEGIKLAQAAIAQEGRGFWDTTQRRDWTHWLDSSEQRQLREQMVELILLEARARTYLANLGGSETTQRRALEWGVRWLDRAERINPEPTPALYGDRARYLAALGLAERAGMDRARESATPPRNSRDFALLGTSLLVKREWPEAEAALRRAVELDRRRFWAWFGLGFCRFEQGRYLEAAGDFAVCTALEPDFAWPYLNQGLALACAGRLNDAFSAYNQALQKDPLFTEALVNRALTRLELNDLTGAEGDLNRAITLGRREPNVLAARGEVLARLGRRDEAERLYDGLLQSDPDSAAIRIARAVLQLRSDPAAARQDLTRVLNRNPKHARALYVMARLVEPDDPSQALGYVDQALQTDPSLTDARQLRALLRARQGKPGANDDVNILLQAPTPNRLYNAACALAVLTRTDDPRHADRALDLLRAALDAGFPVARAAADPDLQPLHDRPEFQALIQRSRAAAADPVAPPRS